MILSAPDDTARLVGWLLSDQADWVTGQTIALTVAGRPAEQ